jgi:hypothetical protein
LRDAFAAWGAPRQLRVDNGYPWGSCGEFPPDLALWAIGLGVALHWNAPRCPQENGVVERSHGTAERWGEPWACGSPRELQGRLDRLDRLQREDYPYRGGPGRTAFFPGLGHSGRPYDPAREGELWRWPRVAEHLAGLAARRRVDSRGQVSVYGWNHYVGAIHRGEDVYVMYDPGRGEWVFADDHGRQVRSMPAACLTPRRVMDLEVTNRRT